MQEAVTAYFLIVESGTDILVKVYTFTCWFSVDFSIPSGFVVDEVN
jgi:hypothetical protein